MYLIENNLSCKKYYKLQFIEKNYSLNITSKNSKNSIFTVFTIIETSIDIRNSTISSFIFK